MYQHDKTIFKQSEDHRTVQSLLLNNAKSTLFLRLCWAGVIDTQATINLRKHLTQNEHHCITRSMHRRLPPGPACRGNPGALDSRLRRILRMPLVPNITECTACNIKFYNNQPWPTEQPTEDRDHWEICPARKSQHELRNLIWADAFRRHIPTSDPDSATPTPS